MNADVRGLSSIDRPAAPPVPSQSGASVPPGRALTRGARPDPDSTAAATSTATSSSPAAERPLQGSGLDPHDVLGTTDRIASRLATGGVALEVGLEQARQALVRSRPGDTLAALDGIWDGAQQTEEGWYLRSGALCALGMPTESDRVAGDGLRVRPSSNALSFLQSLARMTSGDFVGARASLQVALSRCPFEPVLQVQHALLQAKAGDATAAEAALLRLWSKAPDHPALVWGRGALAAQRADDTRRRSRGVELEATDAPTADAVLPRAPDSAAEEPARATPDEQGAGALLPPEATDLASAALERLGARLAQRAVSMSEIAQEARSVLRALSAGGALANAMSAEQAHAARVVLVTIAAHAGLEDADTTSPLSRMIAQIVPMLGHGQCEDARLVVQRQRNVAREPVSRLLLAIIRGAASTITVAEGRSVRSTEPVVQGALPGVVQGDVERGPLSAIRLGLGLLEESSGSRAADASLRLAPAASEQSGDRILLSERGRRPASFASPDASPDAPPDALHDARLDAEHSGEGWGAAQQAATRPFDDRDATGAPMRLIAIIVVILAVVALATGHGVLATALGIGATWLGLRGSRSLSTQERTAPRIDRASSDVGERRATAHTSLR